MYIKRSRAPGAAECSPFGQRNTYGCREGGRLIRAGMIEQDLFVRFNCKIHRWDGGEVRESSFRRRSREILFYFSSLFLWVVFGFFHDFIFVRSREEEGRGVVGLRRLNSCVDICTSRG